MAATSDSLQRGMVAPDFALPGTDGRSWRYVDAAGPAGLVVMFICNHCPYVKAEPKPARAADLSGRRC